MSARGKRKSFERKRANYQLPWQKRDAYLEWQVDHYSLLSKINRAIKSKGKSNESNNSFQPG